MLNPRSRRQSKRFKNGCKQPYAAHTKNLTLSISTRSTSRFIQTSSHIHMWHRQQTWRSHFKKKLDVYGCIDIAPDSSDLDFFYKQIIHTSIKLYWFYMQPHIRIVCVLIKLNNFSCFTTSYVNKNSYTTKITLNKPILSTLLSLLIM